MGQYIDKNKIELEIKKHKLFAKDARNYAEENDDDIEIAVNEEVEDVCSSLLSFLDTIEVKEVNLDEEFDKYTSDNFWALEGNNESPYLVEKYDMLKVAKHFFELGLKAQKGE